MQFDRNNLIKNLIGYPGHKFKVTESEGYVLPRILKIIPDDVDTVYEPFAGLGCISFNIALNNPDVKIRLSDNNKGLVKIFNDIKNDPVDVYQQLENEIKLIDSYDTNDSSNEYLNDYYLVHYYNHKYEDLPIARLLLYTKFSIMGSIELKQGVIYKNKCTFKVNLRNWKKENRIKYLNEMESKILKYSDLMNSIDFKYEYKDWNEVFKEKLNKNDLLILDPSYTNSVFDYGQKEVKWDDIFNKYKKYGSKVYWIQFDYYNRERPLDKTLLVAKEYNNKSYGYTTNCNMKVGNNSNDKPMEYILSNIRERY